MTDSTRLLPGLEAHVFRNPELGIKEERAFLRSERGMDFPLGRHGFVVEDLDVLLRWYSKGYCQCEHWQGHPCAHCQGMDADGRLRLVEIKYRPNGVAILKTAQERTFRLLDSMIVNRDRYDGFYVAAYQQETLSPAASFVINGQPMDAEVFRRWCLTAHSWIPSHQWG